MLYYYEIMDSIFKLTQISDAYDNQFQKEMQYLC